MLQDRLKFKRWVDQLAGSVGARLNTGRRIFGFALISAGFVGFLWFTPWVLTVPLGASVYFPYEPDGRSRFVQVTGPLSALLGLNEWASEREIPQACFAAVVAAEDTRFRSHGGVDWESLRSVVVEQKRQNGLRRMRGASTITQQLVKNLYLSRTRSVLRKAREIWGALLLETVASKQTILTWYLNVVELGPQVYGLTQAARFYFKKEARELLPHECVSLAVILPSPLKWNASLRSGRYSDFFSQRYGVVAARMKILAEVPGPILRAVRSGAPFGFAERDVGSELPALFSGEELEAHDASEGDEVEAGKAAEIDPDVPQAVPSPPPLPAQLGWPQQGPVDPASSDRDLAEFDEDRVSGDDSVVPAQSHSPDVEMVLPRELPDLPVDLPDILIDPALTPESGGD